MAAYARAVTETRASFGTRPARAATRTDNLGCGAKNNTSASKYCGRPASRLRTRAAVGRRGRAAEPHRLQKVGTAVVAVALLFVGVVTGLRRLLVCCGPLHTLLAKCRSTTNTLPSFLGRWIVCLRAERHSGVGERLYVSRVHVSSPCIEPPRHTKARPGPHAASFCRPAYDVHHYVLSFSRLSTPKSISTPPSSLSLPSTP